MRTLPGSGSKLVARRRRPGAECGFNKPDQPPRSQSLIRKRSRVAARFLRHNPRPVSTTPNICAGPFGAFYDYYIERPWLMRSIGRAVWGIDASVLYASMEFIARVPAGATIIDVPCGGGVAFRALQPGQDVLYLAGDLCEKMLARARRRAIARSLDQVDLLTADMTALPFADRQADLFVSYSGLHMVSDPERAVNEIARCLKPGGRLVGTTFLADVSRRARALFAIGSLRGHPLPPQREDLRRWLTAAGMVDVAIGPQRGFVAFGGRRG
jgi:SAM-dependent methyltransferase